jgi:hypothetical protein
MEPSRNYVVRIAGGVRGPMGVEQMRDLASVDVVTPETEIATDAAGPWVRIATLPIFAEVFPERRALAFKSKQFEEINRDSTPAVDLEETIERSKRIPAALRGREVIVKQPGLGVRLESDQPSEVLEMVRDVTRRVAANAPPPPPPPPVKSRFRRWPWFAALSLVGTGGILCIPLFYDRQYDDWSVAILTGWIGLFNALVIFLFGLDVRLGEQERLSKGKMETMQ